MAIRSDFTIDWESSPRIIIVDTPSVECSMQDLLDTLRNEEAKTANMDNDSIVSASGLEPLGGGVKVGMTVALQNAQIGFEARSGPTWELCSLEGGNLVSFDTDGVTTIVPLYPTAFVQISKTSSSSATQSDLAAIQYASYGGGVSIDINATENATGIVYPTGNQEFPANNLADVVTIANNKGFHTVYFNSNFTLDSDAQFGSFICKGHSHVNTEIVVEDAAGVSNTVFQELIISGILDGGNSLTKCIVGDLDYVNGHIYDSSIIGIITLDGNNDAFFVDCNMSDWDNVPEIDMNGTGQDLIMVNYTGQVYISNMTGSARIGIGLNSGQVILRSTIIAGMVHVSGDGELIDEAGNTIVTGTWNGGVTIINTLTNPQAIANAVMSYDRDA